MSKEIPEGFDWLTELEALSKGKWISIDQADELTHMSSDWPTCACGQLCALLPRDPNGAPKDKKLEELGMQFMSRIQDKHWCLALKTFKQIERRTAKLLDLQFECEEVNNEIR